MNNYCREDGYLAFTDIFHPLARKDGSVLLHRAIYAEYYDDYDLSAFHVHHLDGNKLNNDPLNLVKLSVLDHLREHTKYREDITCPICGSTFHPKGDYHKVCSKDCRSLYKSKQQETYYVSEDLLQTLILITPLSLLAKELGVSDVALKKRIKARNLLIPSRLGVRNLEYRLYIYELLK